MLFEAEYILEYNEDNHKNHTGKLIDGVGVGLENGK